MFGKRVAGVSAAGMLLAALAVLWPATAAADTGAEPGWRLRFYAASISFDNNTRGAPGRGGYGIDVGAALGLNAEYRFSRRLGIDFGALAGGGVDVVGRPSWIWAGESSVYDTLTFTALTAGLDVHLTPDNKVDFYLCPMVAMMQYGASSSSPVAASSRPVSISTRTWRSAVTSGSPCRLATADAGRSTPI